jgi:putative ABC transport system permease protein
MLALKNLNRNKIRTFLTLVGVTIGVAMLVSITSYSDSIKDQFQQAVTKSFDIVVQSENASSPLASRLTEAEYQQLAAVNGVATSAGIVIGAIKTPKIPYFILTGTSSIEPLLGNLSLIGGRLMQPGKNEVLLGQRALNRFGHQIGDELVIAGGQRFAIVGSYISGTRVFDQGVLMDLDAARRLLKRENNLNLVLLRVAAGHRPRAVMSKIKSNLPHLAAARSSNLLSGFRFFVVMDKISWGLSAIALILSGVFVINTLIMSVAERTREIGILMAVGWSRGMIVQTIFLESLIICCAGGLLGMLSGWLLLWAFSQSGMMMVDWATPAISLKTMGYAMGLTLGMGVASAIYPAYVATRLTPAQALRVE